MNAIEEQILSITNYLPDLGLVERHFLALVMVNFLLTSKKDSLVSKIAIIPSVLGILGHFLISIKQPFFDDNLFRLTGLTRSRTSNADIEGIIGDLEDKFFGDEVKQEFINELEEKLLGDAKNYHIKSNDLFGDQFDILSFNGKLSTQIEMRTGEITAEFLIFAYSSMIFFAPKCTRFLKLVYLLVGGFCGYLCFSEFDMSGTSHNDLPSLKDLYQFEIFEQFCTFNLVQLAKNGISCFSCLIVALSFVFRKREHVDLERKVAQIGEYSGDRVKAVEALDAVISDLRKIQDKKKANKRSNKRFLGIMMLFLVGSFVIVKGETLYNYFG